MRACRAVPIYFISTLIKRKLIATSLIMLQAAFDDWNGKTKKKKETKNKTHSLTGSASSTRVFRRQHILLMMKINRPFNTSITRQCQRY